MTVKPLKLNLGSGFRPMQGYVNIDKYPEEGVKVDMVGDFMEMQFENVDEVVMSHVLEHLSWRITDQVLMQIRDWMRPGGKIIIEVPDMETLLPECVELMQIEYNFDWLIGVFGAQVNGGEYHLAGFTEKTLCTALGDAGWRVTHTKRFRSEVLGREYYPCLEVKAVNPA